MYIERAERPLFYLHRDTIGKITFLGFKQLIGQDKYVVIILDDKTRRR